MTRLLLLDNYDSFTHNLAHGLMAAGADVEVRRNDAIDRAGIAAAHYDGIVLSPGPGSPTVPRDFGVCADVITDPLDVPMLGICLGMQGMAAHTGGRVLRAPEIVHGEARATTLVDHPIFAGIPATVQVGRYHSLCVDAASLPDAWQRLGHSDDGILMAMAHRERPWVGLQFHPESILSPEGPIMLQNFVEMC